jgi:hypothetical protein
MTGDQSKFLKLNEKGKGKVTFGDNMSAKILGKGNVRLGNNKTKAEDVLLVENIKPNLLSVRKTCYQGHILTFDSQKCEIIKRDTGKLVAVAPRTSSNVYILNIDEEDRCCLRKVIEFVEVYIFIYNGLNESSFYQVGDCLQARSCMRIGFLTSQLYLRSTS